MKQCPKCGRKWPDTGKFCPFDGTSLQEQPQPQAAAPGAQGGGDASGADAIRTSKTVVIESAADLDALRKAGAGISKPKKKKAKKPDFSETQWFMKGITPEDLEDIDADTADLDEATKRYERQNIATTERAGFSLADDFRHHQRTEHEKDEAARNPFALKKEADDPLKAPEKDKKKKKR